MGWEYVLVDENWTIMDNGNIHDVIRYAKEKGVGVLLSSRPAVPITWSPENHAIRSSTRRSGGPSCKCSKNGA